MNWLNGILKQLERTDQIYHNNLSYSKRNDIFIPTETSDIRDFWSLQSDIATFFRAYHYTEILDHSILDESLPKDFGVSGWSYKYGIGRTANICMLGLIRNEASLPKLLEAAKHDIDLSIRTSAIEAIGDMYGTARHFSGDLSQMLLNKNDTYQRRELVIALGKIGCIDSVPAIRETTEDAISMVDTFSQIYWNPDRYEKRKRTKGIEELYSDMRNGQALLEHSIVALFKLDSTHGYEMFSKILDHHNPHVSRFASKAVSIYGSVLGTEKYNVKIRLKCIRYI